MDFSDRLKQLRKENGLTQAELAKALGVSASTVALWETGRRKPQFEMFDKLSGYFDRSMDYILGTSDNPRSPVLTAGEIDQLGEWCTEERYEDMVRRYALLDDYGKAAVDAVLRAEFKRSQEQGTLNSGQSLSVSVLSKANAE